MGEFPFFRIKTSSKQAKTTRDPNRNQKGCFWRPLSISTITSIPNKTTPFGILLGVPLQSFFKSIPHFPESSPRAQSAKHLVDLRANLNLPGNSEITPARRTGRCFFFVCVLLGGKVCSELILGVVLLIVVATLCCDESTVSESGA